LNQHSGAIDGSLVVAGRFHLNQGTEASSETRFVRPHLFPDHVHVHAATLWQAAVTGLGDPGIHWKKVVK
jgi:hypothetical protein